MKIYEKVFFAIIGLSAIFLTAKCVREDIGNKRALEEGICIKAHPSTGLFRSTTFNIYVKYRYKGKVYSGELRSAKRIIEDSILIKILPEDPNYLSWCETQDIKVK